MSKEADLLAQINASGKSAYDALNAELREEIEKNVPKCVINQGLRVVRRYFVNS